MGDSKSPIGLVLLGLAFGAILTFILLRKPQTVSAQPPIQQSHNIQPIQQYDLQYNWQPIDIPRVDDIKQVEQRYIQPIQQYNLQYQPIDIPRVDDVKQVEQQLDNDRLPGTVLNKDLDQADHQKSSQSLTQIIQIDPQLIQATSQLKNNMSKLEHAVYKLQDTISTIRQNTYEQKQDTEQQLKTSHQQPLHNTIYKNDEKWEIKRGPDGRIKSLNIIRDVKKND